MNFSVVENLSFESTRMAQLNLRLVEVRGAEGGHAESHLRKRRPRRLGPPSSPSLLWRTAENHTTISPRASSPDKHAHPCAHSNAHPCTHRKAMMPTPTPTMQAMVQPASCSHWN